MSEVRWNAADQGADGGTPPYVSVSTDGRDASVTNTSHLSTIRSDWSASSGKWYLELTRVSALGVLRAGLVTAAWPIDSPINGPFHGVSGAHQVAADYNTSVWLTYVDGTSGASGAMGTSWMPRHAPSMAMPPPASAAAMQAAATISTQPSSCRRCGRSRSPSRDQTMRLPTPAAPAATAPIRSTSPPSWRSSQRRWAST